MTSLSRRVTIADVARAAGVAPSTVSRALNGSPNCTPATRERVMRAVAETGFVVNRRGRALAVGRSEAIALLFTDPLAELFADPTYARLCDGIVSRLSDGPNLPMILEAATPTERRRVLEHVGRGAVDAVIVITPYAGSELLDRLAELKVPVVLCGQLEGDPYRGVFSTVYSDDVAGAVLAARALEGVGREEFISIMGPAETPVSADRLRGYRHVLGLRLGEDRVVHTGWDQLSGHRAMREILAHGIGFDAVLAGSDRIAVGVIEALRDAGRDVPGEVSVVGFDDHPLAAQYEPAITTVHQPLREEGERAAELALEMIDGAASRTVVMDMHLVERDTV
ncbi:LacI family DNA-binding transcriptional regulator [Actinomyces qiguomingii]|uniref:LacI family DNA-binding transcriptional regulator n=1 Tax=Actinomyces qiguomingii TaxID=2057800 RepID=UPI000CA06BC1|nr:LacI family DNA-binding transcriptional regulator [Actinomyces qiguomingii]